MQSLSEFVKANKLFVAAHRGSSGTAPENTMAAYRQALGAGAKMIEIDIQFTTDNRIIAFHDDSLIRTTNGLLYAKEFAYEDLKNIDVGSWFDEKYKSERIPLLSDVLDLIKDCAYLNIEIKLQKTSDYSKKILQLIDMVKRYRVDQQVLFASFEYNLLSMIKEYDANLHTAAIKLPDDNRLPSELAAELGCEAYVCALSELNPEISNDTAKNNISLGVYTVDDKEELLYALEYNVNAFGTNFPEQIIKELKLLEKI